MIKIKVIHDVEKNEIEAVANQAINAIENNFQYDIDSVRIEETSNSKWTIVIMYESKF